MKPAGVIHSTSSEHVCFKANSAGTLPSKTRSVDLPLSLCFALLKASFTVIFLFLLGVDAQTFTFSGSFSVPSQSGGKVILALQQDAQGQVTGTMQGDNATFEVQASTDPGGFIVGVVSDGKGGGFAFEAYPGATSEQLILSIYGDNGEAQEIVFQREASVPTPASQENAAQPNPLAPGNPLASQNPLGADPWLGSFSDGTLNVVLQGANGTYTGTLELAGQRYPLKAQASATELTGQFEANGSSFAFSAKLEGDKMNLSSGGNSYVLSRQMTTNPLASTTSTANPMLTSDPIIAQGSGAKLSQDNALAFIEALEFALQQSGYAKTFAEADKQQMLQALTQNFAQSPAEDQMAMARMREIWTGVKARWATFSPDDQGGIILEIFSLAFGREAVQAYLQQSQVGAQSDSSSGACQTIDDCIYKHASPGQISSMNGQSGCWSSAGCVSYDSQTNTRYYEDR